MGTQSWYTEGMIWRGVPVRLPRVVVVLRRIAFDIDEVARARRVEDLQAAQSPTTRAPSGAADWPNPT